MSDRQRAGLAIVLWVICMMLLRGMSDELGVPVERLVFFFLATVGLVMLAAREA